MSSRIAVIFGAGPGLGAALAQSLGSSTHNVLLLSRSLPGSLPKLGLQIPDAESRVLACSSDGSPDSLKAALEQARNKWPKGKFDVGISNAGPKFSVGGFLDQKEELARQNLEVFMGSAWNFAQALIPLMLKDGGGSLLFTGATMSLRGGANFSISAPTAFARRGLSQSLAREFGPKGIHVAHVIVDGIIETERIKGILGEAKGEATRLEPNDIAQTVVALISQPKSAWTYELDLRPMHEKW
ncbi:hypothetical protein JCM24511_05474 [Saitozyma sp. JCM 24511]|nr:hypothetical protein JCM24511_05474 [Saitozyma sp. JCM 24511]